MTDLVYRLGDGRLWDVGAAAWTDRALDRELVDLASADGASDEAYLIRTLNFYGHDLGCLAPLSVMGEDVGDCF